jgi:hypothetical protein
MHPGTLVRQRAIKFTLAVCVGCPLPVREGTALIHAAAFGKR